MSATRRTINVIGICVGMGASAVVAQTQPATSSPPTTLKYHAPSVASDPGGVVLSLDRLFALAPELAPPKDDVPLASAPSGSPVATAPANQSTRPTTQPTAVSKTVRLLIPESQRLRIIETLKEHLMAGDSRAAVVMSTNPLLVAAYTDELDAVAILQFPDSLVKEHGLKVGSRLLTVNVYPQAKVPDMELGPKNLGRYGNFFPIIADFVTDAPQRVDQRKLTIAEEEWQRCQSMGEAYRRAHPTWIRNGSPLYSAVPAQTTE